MGRGFEAGVDLGAVRLEVDPAGFRLADHLLEPADLLAKDRDLAIDPGDGIVDEGTALVRIMRGSEDLATRFGIHRQINNILQR